MSHGEGASSGDDDLSVLVVEGHSVISDALVLALRSCGVGAAMAINPTSADLQAVVEAAVGCTVLLAGLLVGDGGTTLAAIRALVARDAKVLAFTTDQGTVLAGQALRAGVEAVVHKDIPLERLVEAIRAVHAGRCLLPDDERTALLEQLVAVDEGNALLRPFQALFEREATTLRHLVEGRSPSAVALAEQITIHTVRKHIHSVLAKLGVQSQREALALARHAGWPPPELTAGQ
jgi:DNA-binding NarL/FixJ family response regulator